LISSLAASSGGLSHLALFVVEQNLLLSTKNRLDGTIKIIDFGCAVVSDDYLDDDDDDDDESVLLRKKKKKRKVAKKASSTGTTAYWAPERFIGENTEATPAMDMWSVGVILYVRRHIAGELFAAIGLGFTITYVLLLDFLLHRSC